MLSSAEQPKNKMDRPPVVVRKILHQHKNHFEDMAILHILKKRLTPKLKITPYYPLYVKMRNFKTECFDLVTQNPIDAKVWDEVF